MFKRDLPFTPEPVTTTGLKKNREYSSPLNRTPLRNVLPSGKSALAEEVRNAPRTPINDDIGEKRAHRAAIAQSRRQQKKNLLSPAIKTTPKANPPSLRTPQPTGTPLTPSLIRVETAAVKPVTAPVLTAEQRNKMFEEWMKIAADNKINAKNSWNVALIDYFSELTFLRDGDSINFQRASCTLDSCVKIYSSRVDSVADETGKLLNGLADGKNPRAKLERGQGEGDDVLEQDAGQEEKKIRSSKRPHRAVDTLEKSFHLLDLKNFELEFSIDPLFKKTCAEFDESGSKGFLTSNLNLTANGMLLLDSSTAYQLDAEPEEAQIEDHLIDVSALLPGFTLQVASLEGRLIAPSLRDYSFGGVLDLKKMDQQLAATLARLAAEPTRMDIEPDPDSSADEGEPEFELPDEQVPLDDGMYEYYDEAPLEPIQRDGDEVTVESVGLANVDLNDSFLSYFDSQMHRNWAGPEHWKIQRPHLRRLHPEAPKPRHAKKEFVLDFNSAPVDISTIFVKANPATITLTRSTLEERRERDNLLPEDLHFSSSELLRLFTNPIGKRKDTQSHQAQASTIRPDLQSHQVEPSYWANVQNLDATSHLTPSLHQDLVPLDDGPYDDDIEEGYYDEPLLPSQETMDDPCRPMALAPIGKDDMVPTFRPITTTAIHYARRAKKVDVQELKQVLWSGISSGPSKLQEHPMNFAQVIQQIPKSNLALQSLQDVSVPYCFICLLHLANEHNLLLETSSTDLLISQETK